MRFTSKATAVRAVITALKAKGIPAQFCPSDDPEQTDDDIEVGNGASLQVSTFDGIEMTLSYWEDEETVVHGTPRRTVEAIVSDVLEHRLAHPAQ